METCNSDDVAYLDHKLTKSKGDHDCDEFSDSDLEDDSETV